MKKYIKLLIVIAVALLFSSSCFENVVEDYTADVSFYNNSTTKTVCPIWDGVRYGTLAPGGSTNVYKENPGSHSIQWQTPGGKALTSVGYPTLVADHSYQYPYND